MDLLEQHPRKFSPGHFAHQLACCLCRVCFWYAAHMVLKGQAQDDTITFQAELKPISAMQPTVGLLGATKQISLTATCFARDSDI